VKTGILLLPCALLICGVAVGAGEGTQSNGIRVEVSGFRNNHGRLGCALFNSTDGFPREREKALKRMWAPIQGDHAECMFDGVPAGAYAVTIFHDEDSSGKFKKNLLGYPLEGYGFSNNVSPQLSAPSFDECKFQYDGTVTKQIPIAMIYR
jgi:uncharacterized protein (DUF2141 family)